jgi:carbon-monoxide dehydrogenase medium subunit
VKSARFQYEKPRALAEAIKLLAAGGGMAKLIAGGQSFGPMLNLRLAQPDLLVDVRGLPELLVASEDKDAVTLGACTTHAAIEDGRVPDATAGMMRFVARDIAYRAIRNRGTIGGSLAHADPAGDWVSVLMLLDATVIINGPKGERRVPASQFVTGALATALAEDEILTAVRIARFSPKARWSYYKFCRKTGEFAEAIAGFVVDPERGIARAVIGAAEGAPVLIADATPLIGGFDQAIASKATTGAGFQPGSYEFQVHMAALKRAFLGLQQGGLQ